MSSRISESNYILATNLAKLRIVEHALHSVVPTSECPDADLREAKRLLEEMRRKCEQTVDAPQSDGASSDDR